VKKNNPKADERSHKTSGTVRAKAEPARILPADVTTKGETERGIDRQKQGISTHGKEEQRKQAKVVPIRAQGAHGGTHKHTGSRRRAS
jgi:hypothetical protein